MKPKKPYLGTIQVPLDVLLCLSKRRLTNSEARVVLAVCSLAEITPGLCQATIEQLAKIMGTNRDIAATLVAHAIAKNILAWRASGLGPLTKKYQVQAPSFWGVPG